MKKITIVILILCCIITLFSCANNDINTQEAPKQNDINTQEVPKQSDLNNDSHNLDSNDDHDNGGTPNSNDDHDNGGTPNSNDDHDNGGTPNETVGNGNEAIGGTHMGDELYSPYNGYVDTVIIKKGTFSENYGKYMKKYDEMRGKWENNRPAVMYHLAREMELTRDDLETYYNALGYENVPESVYAGLLADTLEESMQLLKTEYAFYNNGKLYTIYDVYEMQETKTFAFDITDAAYDSVWENINAYLNSEYAYDVGENIIQFVRQKADTIK